jgi:hypothetical protein
MSLKKLDLKDSIGSKIHVDEFKAKMGDDDEIIVISFKSNYKDQAIDLVNFLEKGYEWILDADVSSGELEDGSYVVFLETMRKPSVANKLIKLLSDLSNLTDLNVEDYKFKYHKDSDYTPVSVETLTAKIPLEPRKYRKLFKNKDDIALENMQMQAGLAPKSETITDPELKAFVNLSK